MAEKKKKGRPSREELARRQAEKERELKKERRRAGKAVALMAAGVFFLVLAVYKEESAAVWVAMRGFLFGVLGMLSYLVGPVLIGLGVLTAMKRSVDGGDAVRWSLLTLAVSSATYVFSVARPTEEKFFPVVKELYEMGRDEVGTGLVSAVLGYPLDKYLGDVGGKVTAAILVLASLMLVFSVTPLDLARWISLPFVALFRWIWKSVAAARERRRLEYENSISLETLRQTESYEEKAARIDVPLEGERRKRGEPEPRKPIDIPLAGENRATFAPEKERKIARRAKYLPDIDVDMGPDFDPKAEGISLDPTGPAGSVVKDVLGREARQEAQNREMFAQFSTGGERTLSEMKAASEHFIQAGKEMEKAAAGAGTVRDASGNLVMSEEVAALARKADAEYLSNVNAPTADPAQTRAQTRVYKLPPIHLLNKQAKKDERSMENELSRNAELLIDTLESFGVHCKVVDISRGPTVTRYELLPETGVRLNRITQLADEIALNMEAVSVRIEAPIPGKAAVGIEIPNKTVQTVNLRTVIESEEFQKSDGKLTVALGQDVSGAVKVGDLEKMIHMLIAGATGMGKSVCINSILISLLYKYSPEELKLILVDPKMVEFNSYNGLPHLFLPVVTDTRKAAGALGWAVSEMLKRYRRFSETGCRNITEYNAWVKRKLANPNYRPEPGEEEPAPLPRVVIVIDELADLMMVAPNEVEDAIARLAQMARAAGMHLILATQRPSVDVITGVIKNNIPSRVAFAVSSQVDSRTILDGAGAEKLLGRGDMLYMPIGQTKSTRIQGCFVTDGEVARVVKYITERYKAEYDDEIIREIEKATPQPKGKGGGSADEFDDGRDPMYEEAVECVLEAGQASTSMLQRRLRLGYARAARIIDAMEQDGIVSEAEGSKPRQIKITKQQWLERLTSQGD